ITGQILRNHPTIDGTDKMRLIKECASLTRRMIGSFFAKISESAPEMIAAVEKAVLEKRPQLDRAKVMALANAMFAMNAEAVVVSIIESYADNFGVTTLGPAFKRVRRETRDTSLLTLDLAVRLENPRIFPEIEANEVYKAFHDNPFMKNCLRALVF